MQDWLISSWQQPIEPIFNLSIQHKLIDGYSWIQTFNNTFCLMITWVFQTLKNIFILLSTKLTRSMQGLCEVVCLDFTE